MKFINEFYSIMDDYETEGLDLYNYGLIEALQDMFYSHKVDFKYDTIEWGNEQGGTCAFSWIENNTPQLIMFEFKY